MLQLALTKHWHGKRTVVMVGLITLSWSGLWVASKSLPQPNAPDKEFIAKAMSSMFSWKPEKSALLPSGEQVPTHRYEALTLLPSDYRDSLLRSLSTPDGNVARVLRIKSVSLPKIQERGEFTYSVNGEMVNKKDGKRVKVEPFYRVVFARCKERKPPCEGEMVDIRK